MNWNAQVLKANLISDLQTDFACLLKIGSFMPQLCKFASIRVCAFEMKGGLFKQPTGRKESHYQRLAKCEKSCDCVV